MIMLQYLGCLWIMLRVTLQAPHHRVDSDPPKYPPKYPPHQCLESMKQCNQTNSAMQLSHCCLRRAWRMEHIIISEATSLSGKGHRARGPVGATQKMAVSCEPRSFLTRRWTIQTQLIVHAIVPPQVKLNWVESSVWA